MVRAERVSESTGVANTRVILNKFSPGSIVIFRLVTHSKLTSQVGVSSTFYDCDCNKMFWRTRKGYQVHSCFLGINFWNLASIVLEMIEAKVYDFCRKFWVGKSTKYKFHEGLCTTFLQTRWRSKTNLSGEMLGVRLSLIFFLLFLINKLFRPSCSYKIVLNIMSVVVRFETGIFYKSIIEKLKIEIATFRRGTWYYSNSKHYFLFHVLSFFAHSVAIDHNQSPSSSCSVFLTVESVRNEQLLQFLFW